MTVGAVRRALLVTALIGGGCSAAVPAAVASPPPRNAPATEALQAPRLATLRADGRPAQEASSSESLNADGRFITFVSSDPFIAGTLYPRDPYPLDQIYLRDLESGSTRLVSRVPGGARGNDASFDPDISADGSRIVFASEATNLVPGDAGGISNIYLYDVATASLTLITPGSTYADQPAISADGEHVVYRDGNEVHAYDVATGSVLLVSHRFGMPDVPEEGSEPDVSFDGNVIAFSSSSTRLTSQADPYEDQGADDVFVYDRLADSAVQVTRWPGGYSSNTSPAVSADGSHIAWLGRTTHFGYYDVFRSDLSTGRMELVSGTRGGARTEGTTSGPTISDDGYLVGFESESSELVHGDTNGESDAFLYDAALKRTLLVSQSGGLPADGRSGPATVSGSGNRIAFATVAQLDPRDTNDVFDVYVRQVY